MLLLIFLSTALSLNPIYIIPDFDQSPIYVKLTKPELYPECPSDINSNSLSDQNFITQNPKCVAKLLRVRFNTATQKVEQLDGIETYSSDIGVSSEIFTKLTALIIKLRESGYRENVNLFAVGYNFYLHPVTSFTVFSELKKKIEEGSQNSAEKAIILSLGLGSSFSSIFLSNYSNSNWVKQYIEKVIFFAPLFAGSSTFSKLFNQVLEPFPDDDDIKKTISMMPGLQIMLPNYEVFRDKTVIYNLYTDFDQYNASHSFEFLKLQNKVDSESEKIFKSEIEKYLKAPIPEPPVQSFVIYNDAVNQPVSYVINRHKSNKVTTINDIKGDGVVSSEGAEYACTKWKSVKCFNIHNYTNHYNMLTRNDTIQQIIDNIQNNQNDIKKQAIFLASGFNGSPLYATVKDKTKAPSCPSNLNNYLFYSSFANNMYQRIDETNSSLWLSDKCIAHLTRVELNNGKTDVLYSNGVTLQSSKIGDFNHLKGLELLITKMSNKGHVQYKNMFGVGYNYIHFPLLNGDKYQELKNNIEKYFTENGEKSILVGYDQGSLFVEYFLTEYVTTEWAKKYVSAAIFYAPIFGGTGAYNELVTGNIGNGFPNNNEEMKKSISRMPGLHIKMPNEVVFGDKIVIRDMIRDGYTFTSEYAPDLLISLGKMNETAKSIFDLTSKYRKQAPKEPPVPSLIVYNDYINTANGYTYKKNTNSVEAINEKGDGSISADGARYACNNWENAICFNHRNAQASHEQIPIHNATVDLTTTFIDQLHNSKSFPIKKTFTINTVLDDFANLNYVQSHRIGNDKFSYSANADYSGDRKLSNVFDNKDNNYWVPNKTNTDDFKNAITVEFNKMFAIEAILIDTAYNSRTYDNKDVRIFVGFPKRINIYTSANDEDVELNSVFIGNPVHPWKRVQLYTPNPIICKKLKIEFDELTIQNLEDPHDNRPAIADILFIEAYDIIEMKEVKPPYTSIEYSQSSSINKNKIVSYNANGNSKRRYPLSNLFSGDENIWISDKPNTNDFKNDIIITYSKEYEIYAILFDAVFTEEDQKYHGFPLLIKVYTSVNGSDFTFQSGFSGKPNKRVACEFNKQIICDKIKIEFVQLTDQTITDQSKPSNNPALKNLYIIKKIQQTPYTVNSKLYKNSDYVSAQTIDQSLFTRSCNGGSQESFPFENVFDNNNKTYWRSGTENTDEFKNTITIEFTETTQLDAFLYDASFYTNHSVTPKTRTFDGFPKILNIYNSTGDSSELIAIFAGTPAYPMDRVQFVFPFPVICDKLKLEFYEITPLVQSGEMIPTIANLLFIKSNTIFGTYKGTEGKYQEANYIASHKILRNEFTATSNNGDNMDIAFDGAANNYWRPSRVNDDDFKNSITITFREVTEIEAFLYDTSYHTKQNNRDFDGFPTILHVYKSIGDANFELAMIFEGNPVHPWTRIQFVFPEVISCKKLKFVFYEVTPDTDRSNKSQPVIADITLIRNRISFARAAGNYINSAYLSKHQIQKDQFTYSTNAGSKSGYPLDNLFDNTINTYWNSDLENNETFKISVTIEFKSHHNLDAIVLDCSYQSVNGRTYHGYPTIFNIYKSVGNEDFTLAASFGGYPFNDIASVQFVFEEPVSCDKIKAEFYKITRTSVFSDLSPGYYTSIGNLKIIQYEEITPLPNPTPLPTETPTSTPIASPEPTPDPTPEPTPDQTPDPTPDPTPYPTVTPTPFPTETETPTESLTESFYATPTETLEQTPEPTPIPTMTPNETPTSTPSMTPNETPTPIPASTPIPTSSPSFSPTSTPLATPSQSPTVSPAPIENQCTDNNHCEAEGSQSKPIILTILSSSFYNSSMQTNGGAVNIINAGVKCQGINISNCTSNNGVGGGICIYNNVDINADITLEHIQFSECKASSGSAVYIYSDSQISQITIRYCNFTSNNASSLNEKNQYKFGGSAIFIAARKGIISNCHFSNNKGNGGNLKIHNHFDGNEKIRYSSHLLDDVESDFLVSECDFQIEDSTPCSLYYYRGDRGSTFEVNNCIFSGTLNRNARYIDGTAISIDSPKMIVKSCTFYNTYEKSINRANNYLKLNPDDQEFIDPLEELNKNDKRKLSKTTWALIGSVIAVFCLILLLVTLLVFVIICGKRKIKEIEELKMDSKKLEKYQA